MGNSLASILLIFISSRDSSFHILNALMSPLILLLCIPQYLHISLSRSLLTLAWFGHVFYLQSLLLPIVSTLSSIFHWQISRSCFSWSYYASVYRYLRLVVNLFAFLRIRPIPIPDNPKLTAQDVTVVIPTIEGDGEVLSETIRTILATEPFEIILVTINSNLERAKSMVKVMGTSRIKLRGVASPNKRRQMVRAIPEITTDITVFADDDVLWPPNLLPWMLAPLEDETYGGVGTNQRLRRSEACKFQQRVYGYLNALYLERRNFDCASCMYMDGGLPCLSGRTVAYRSNILRDDAFIHGFTHEEWLGRYQLSADDDNFITRWLVSHDKKIGFQYHKEAEVLTTLEDNPNFVKQCLRWSRSNWRSNITSMFCDRHIWR